MDAALAELGLGRPIELAVVLGTRPEVIKLAPVVRLARQRADEFHVRLLLTGQHRELADRLMDEFGLEADVDLDLMRRHHGLAPMAAECLRGLGAVLASDPPDWVLVQGDTTTTFAGALAAFYNRIRVGHVEAGLRTGCPNSPFPEEMNRRLTTSLAELHFAPTETARANLLEQGVAPGVIVVTGNTGIDSLFEVRRRLAGETTPESMHAMRSMQALEPPTMQSISPVPATRRYALVTVHRRENHGPALARICDGLLALLDRHADLGIVLPVHPSPQVQGVVCARLGRHPRVVLAEPLGHAAFVQRLVGAALVLTDSGGVQEECAALGKPVLVLRDDTERQEAVDAGVAMLVGTAPQRIVDAASKVLSDAEVYDRMAQPSLAFGDGRASARILDALKRHTSTPASRR